MPPILPAWARARSGGRGIVLSLHVQPGARVSGPAGRHGDALKLRIAAPATDNRANEALVDFLHRSLQLPRSAVRITHGTSSRQKVVEVGVTPEQAAARLRAWDEGRAE
jgi:uncharacterized protein (TIGR00251 family)